VFYISKITFAGFEVLRAMVLKVQVFSVAVPISPSGTVSLARRLDSSE
jgi:hypothetical protein